MNAPQWFPCENGRICILDGRELGRISYGVDSQGDPLIQAKIRRDWGVQTIPCADEAGAMCVVQAT